jgi:hypothetical protein
VAGKNGVLNASMNVWQRGTTTTLTSTSFVADRWQAIRSVAGGTGSRQATGDTTNLPNIQYCLRFQRTAGQTAVSGNFLAQNLETINSIPYSGKTVTVSFYARAGANFSGTLQPVFVYGTGTDQNVYTGFTGQTTLYNTAASLTTTWQRFTFTVAVPATSTQLGFYFAHSASGTAGANDYFDTTGIQIDLGSVALPFRTYAGTLQGELAACQRYYWRSHTNSTYDNFALGYGKAGSTTIAQVPVPLKVTMRTAPSSVDYANLYLYDGSTNPSVSAVTFAGLTTTPDSAFVEATSAVLVASKPYVLNSGTSTSSYIGFSAEL